MKSKLITRATAGLAACVLAVSLTACGGAGGAGDIRNSKEPVALSQAFGTKGLWFESYDAPGKDEGINTVLSFDGEGNVTRYDMSGVDFSDIKDLSDEEIIELAKKQDKKNFEAWSESSISSIDELLDGKDSAMADAQDELNQVIAAGAPEEIIAEYQQNIEDVESNYSELQGQRDRVEALEYQEPSAVPYELTIETDDSGNNTAEETLSFTVPVAAYYEYDSPYDEDVLWEDKEMRYTVSLLEDPVEMSVVYDRRYAGYSGPGLWTQVGENFNVFGLDTPDTEGIEVD